MHEWLRGSGAHLMISDGAGSLEGLELHEATALAPGVFSNGVAVPFGFEQADPNYLAERIRPMLESSYDPWHMRVLSPRFDPQLETRRDSFCFRTAKGTIGILQILDVENNPPGVRVRYKVLRRYKLVRSTATAGWATEPEP